jgi:hypothetical protein
MMVARESVDRRPRPQTVWLLTVGMLIALAAGCAPSAPMPPIPADLPLTANQDIFTIRWALQKEPTVTRAVGTLTTPNVTPSQVTMGLFGLDSGGSIVSRGTSFVRPTGFGHIPLPFSVELTPTGREVRYDLRVLDYRFPGFRMN